MQLGILGLGTWGLGTWGLIVTAILGCVVGLRYRVGALVAATLLAAALLAAGTLRGWIGTGEGLISLALLQVGYLAGVLISSLGRRRPR